MANWETGSTGSSYNNMEALKNQISGRSRTDDLGFGGQGFESLSEMAAFDDAVSSVPDFWNFVKGIKEYSVVGIDGSQISTMTGAIESYVSDIQQGLEDAINTTRESIKGGFRGGDVEKAVQDYMDKVKEYIFNLVSSLNLFVDKLNDVGNAWVAAQQSFGSSVNSSAGSFSAGTAYQAGSQVTYNGASRE